MTILKHKPQIYILALATILVSIFAAGCLQSSSSNKTASVNTAPVIPIPDDTPACKNPTELQHILHPDRFIVLNPCVTITGTVVEKTYKNDGALYYGLKVDPQYADIIRQKNITERGSDIFVGAICGLEVMQLHWDKMSPETIPTCNGYEHTDRLADPVVDEKIKVTGRLVLDAERIEIFPAYEIKENYWS